MIDFTHHRYVMLDLDGTLLDSQEGIFNSVCYAMDRLGLERPDAQTLRRFIGPSLAVTFREVVGLAPDTADQAVAFYREFYGTVGILQCALYPGMEDLLARLVSQGKRLALATKKPEIFARRILENMGIEQFFTAVSGSSLQEKSNDKGHILQAAMDGMGVLDKALAVMVGDSEHDCIGARQAGVDCIGVLYGFGDGDAMLMEGAAVLAADVEELTRILCG